VPQVIELGRAQDDGRRVIEDDVGRQEPGLGAGGDLVGRGGLRQRDRARS
jgi:hypothetical protein